MARLRNTGPLILIILSALTSFLFALAVFMSSNVPPDGVEYPPVFTSAVDSDSIWWRLVFEGSCFVCIAALALIISTRKVVCIAATCILIVGVQCLASTMIPDKQVDAIAAALWLSIIYCVLPASIIGLIIIWLSHKVGRSRRVL